MRPEQKRCLLGEAGTGVPTLPWDEAALHQSLEKMKRHWWRKARRGRQLSEGRGDFHGGPVAKTLGFEYRRAGFDPSSGN